MAFTYDPDQSDAVSRVRFDVGDVVAPGLLPDAAYVSKLSRHTSGTGDDQVVDEAAATRDIARGLAAFYATQPDQIGDNGTTIRWGVRVAQWNLIATGTAGGGASSTNPSATGTGFRLKRGPFRDYTTGEGDDGA